MIIADIIPDHAPHLPQRSDYFRLGISSPQLATTTSRNIICDF